MKNTKKINPFIGEIIRPENYYIPPFLKKGEKR